VNKAVYSHTLPKASESESNNLSVLILYLGITFVGYFVGSKLRNSEKELKWTNKVQFVMIISLVFIMGSRIGADKQVVSSLGSIGLTAFILTFFIMTGSVLTVFCTRKLMKLNKEGIRGDD